MFYWFLKRVLLGPLLKAVYRPWVEGLENVPEKGAAILAGNHLSVIDSFFLPLVLDRRVTFLAKDEYFTGTGIKGRFKRAFFSGTGQVPVDRSGGKASEAALRTALRILSKGALLGIYPEGTRSPDGRLYRGKTGVARMALEAKVPVIPVAMVGTEKMQPPGRIIPKIMRPGIRFGKPLDFSRYEGLENDRFVLRSATDEIMYELMTLSGQEYVDMYAARAKTEIAEARKRGEEIVPVPSPVAPRAVDEPEERGPAEAASPTGVPRPVSSGAAAEAAPTGSAGESAHPGEEPGVRAG